MTETPIDAAKLEEMMSTVDARKIFEQIGMGKGGTALEQWLATRYREAGFDAALASVGAESFARNMEEQAKTPQGVLMVAHAVSQMERDAEVKERLEQGETLQAILSGMQRPHFVVRVIPLIPDLITRGKKFMVVLTDRRLIVFRMTFPANRLKPSKIKTLVAEWPLEEVLEASAKGATGFSFRGRSGKQWRFSHVSDGDGAAFAEAVSIQKKTGGAS